MVVPTRAPQPSLVNGSVSVSTATVDATLALIGSAVGGNDIVEPLSAQGATPRKRDQNLHIDRSYRHLIPTRRFPLETRGMERRAHELHTEHDKFEYRNSS
jgi:hypothetical protein